MTNKILSEPADGKEAFKFQTPKSTLTIPLIFVAIILFISIFLIIIAILLMSPPINIFYIVISICLIIGGIFVFILSLNQAYKQYLITSDIISSIPTILFKKGKKEIELKNIAFVIDWDNGLEIAEKNEKTSGMYPETLKNFKVPIIRKYNYIKLPLTDKDEEEQKLKNEILDYLTKHLNLVKHPNFDYVYLSK